MKKDKIIFDFTQNMSSLLLGNLNVSDSLEICSQVSKNCSKLCDFILKNIQQGKTLAYSIENCSFVKFPSFYKNLIGIAQSSGEISSVFEELFSYLQTERKNREKIVQSLLYPLFVVFSTICVAVFILAYVYPKFSIILGEFCLENSSLESSMQKSLFVVKIFICFFIFLIVISVLIFVSYKRFEEAKLICSKIILILPGIGKYFCYRYTKNLVFSLNLLCKNGINFVEALKCASNSISNVAYSLEVKILSSKISSGKSLNVSLDEAKYFPEHFSCWLKIAQRTGKLLECFSQMEVFFEYENEKVVNRFINFLEPFFILISGSLLLFVVIQFVLPIFNSLGGIL